MNKLRQDNDSVRNSTKRIIAYVSFVILILMILGMITACEPDNLDYNPGQVRSFSQKTLTALYQTFPKQTSESKKYQKAKDKNYKSYLSTNALKHSDFHTLIAICKKDPTNLNKAYVYACGWNIEYDKTHMTDYAKCLIYYRNQLSNKETDQISTPLHQIMKSCIADPTGKEQREEDEHRHRDSSTLIPFMLYMNSNTYNSDDDSLRSSSHEDEDDEESSGKSDSDEDEEENSSESDEDEGESSADDSSESESESSESESEPAESEPAESEPSSPAE